MCQKCNKTICCCVKVISKLGKKGLTGPRGPAGTARIIFEFDNQSAVAGSIYPNLSADISSGNIGLTATPTKMLLWIDASVVSEATHTVTYYFKKNGVMVGQTRTRTLGLNDHISFKTGLNNFVSTDTIEFFISSSNATATINNATVHALKQL